MANLQDNSRNLGAEAGAQAQTESARALPAPHLSEIPPGAPPSNTAPANCKSDSSEVLRTGVDSLYLSYSGTLHKHVEENLLALKALAQSKEPFEQARAVLEFEHSKFRILPRGTSTFPFILDDGMFNIRLSSAASEKMPLASVQISSRLLTDSGMEASVDYLDSIIRTFGPVVETKVSRLDICCDFVTGVGFGEVAEVAWLSRSNKRNCYTEAEKFTGYVFGQGSPLSARLYDKTLEIEKSKKDYLRDLWWMDGWDRTSKVWRLEFQIRREVLVELGIYSYLDLQDRLQSLWQYATRNWLRLVLPGKDKTRSRWPNHPLWDVLQAANFGTSSPMPITREHTKRVPLDGYLFTNGLAAIISFMATREIATFKQAGPEFLKAATEHHAIRNLNGGDDVEAYCQKRAAVKAREFSTRFPNTEVKRDPDYRQGKGK